MPHPYRNLALCGELSEEHVRAQCVWDCSRPALCGEAEGCPYLLGRAFLLSKLCCGVGSQPTPALILETAVWHSSDSRYL